MSLPIEFVEKYKNLLGEEESSKFFTAINSPSKKGFRLNPLKNNYQDVQYSLKEPIEFTKDGYYGEISGRDSLTDVAYKQHYMDEFGASGEGNNAYDSFKRIIKGELPPANYNGSDSAYKREWWMK